MPCVDCFRNCDPIVSDRCVPYTGPDIACLGICTDDTLYQVEAAIAEKLCSALDGTGIDLSDVDVTCSFLTDILGNSDPTLVNLMQTLVTASCTLKELIDAINLQINATYTFDTKCLTGTLTNRDEILQAVITKLCDDSDRIALIEADYVKNSDLCTLVQACLSGGGGGTSSTQFKLRMVPYAPIPYVGPLSNFDNTGAGLSAFNFEDVYLMNGLNGTQDWRGRSPIGAVSNVPGGTLDSAVDPTLPANAGLNYSLNQKVGASSVVLATTQMPAHTHQVNDPGHKHTVQEYAGVNNSSPHIYSPTTSSGGGTNTSSSVTGISIQTAGSSQAHTNLQPSIACYYIIYIP